MTAASRWSFRWSWIVVPGLVLAVGAGCARTAETRQLANAPPAPAQPYVRTLWRGTNSVDLQLAVRKLVPNRGRGPTVWLVSAAHLGETNYYERLQQHLDAQTLVLFEGVGSQEEPDEAVSHPPSQTPQGTTQAPRSVEPAASKASLQTTLARSLGLAFQAEAINYARGHFINSDLSIQEIEALLRRPDMVTAAPPPSSPDGAHREFQDLIGLMEGSSLMGGVVQFGVRLLSSHAKLQAVAKLVLIQTMGQIKGDLSQFQGLPPELKGLLKVLVDARNETVMRDLKEELKGLTRTESAAVFYGAAHMQDLENRLVRELGYRPAEEFWLTAISVDLARAGVTPADRQIIDSLVQWQLDALQ